MDVSFQQTQRLMWLELGQVDLHVPLPWQCPSSRLWHSVLKKEMHRNKICSWWQRGSLSHLCSASSLPPLFSPLWGISQHVHLFIEYVLDVKNKHASKVNEIMTKSRQWPFSETASSTWSFPLISGCLWRRGRCRCLSPPNRKKCLALLRTLLPLLQQNALAVAKTD